MPTPTPSLTITEASRRARRRLERIASQRHGVFTRDHARRAGVSDTALDRMCRRGEIVRLHRAVYTFAGAPATERRACMAAVDAASPDACLSGDAGLRLLGLTRHCWGTRDIEVVVPRRHRPAPGVRFICSIVCSDEEWTTVERIRVLKLERQLVERAARGASEAVLCALMDEGAFQHRFSPELMRRVLDRYSTRAGNRRLRRAFQLYLHGDGGAHSDLEARVGAEVEAVVTGRIERNRRRVFGGRRMRPDIFLPDIALAIEIDGMHGHARPTRRRDDSERDSRYRRAGVTSMRIRDTHEAQDTVAVVREIRRRQAALE